MSARVVIYTTHVCPYCTLAKRLWTRRGVEFDEVRVDQRPDLRGWLMETTGQRTVPQIFVDGRPIGGFMDCVALEENGQLDAMWAEPDPSKAVPVLR